MSPPVTMPSGISIAGMPSGDIPPLIMSRGSECGVEASLMEPFMYGSPSSLACIGPSDMRISYMRDAAYAVLTMVTATAIPSESTCRRVMSMPNPVQRCMRQTHTAAEFGVTRYEGEDAEIGAVNDS